MKVLFLDHDGVMCLDSEWGSRYKKRKKAGKVTVTMSELSIDLRFDNFNKKSVRVLNHILEMTNAEIVVSSDWRFHSTLDEMGEFFKSQGVNKVPISFTDSLQTCLPHIWKRIRNFANLELERSLEIKEWLNKHTDVTHWVAVDDLDMSVSMLGDDGLRNFVRTKRINEGIKECGIKEKIINFLN